MIEKIVRATGIFMRALAGEPLSHEQLRTVVPLIALPSERLRYTDPSTLPRHAQSKCDDVLGFTPEERCFEFLDGLRYGAEKRGGIVPSQSACRIVRMYVDDLPPSEEKDLWLGVLEEYRVDDLVERAKRRFEEAGFQVIDPEDLSNGIRELYLKPSVEEVITEELPPILKADPQFFLRNQINLTEVTERLHTLYANDPQMRAKYENPVDEVSRPFKVWLRHVRYFMVDRPNSEELDHAIDKLKKILEGRYLEDNDEDTEHVVYTEVIRLNSIGIPNIYEVRKEQYPHFASYEQVHDKVRRILPFINDSETRKVAMTIMSSGTDVAERAIKAKEVFESYLNEARSLVVNRKKPIPDFYDKESGASQFIERARKAILV